MHFRFVHQEPQHPFGVITGISQNLEFMLPLWWWSYRNYNQHPLLFLDFGMSEKGKKWCQERGILSPPIQSTFVQRNELLDPALVAKWKKLIAGDPLSARDEWFKKPMGLLHSPFKVGIWVDLDCEVKSSLDHIFSLVQATQKIAIALDSPQNEELTTYNSGVVGFPFQSEIISKWAHTTYHENGSFMGDQDVLSKVLYDHPGFVAQLPPEDNMYYQSSQEKARIVHWRGYLGKIELIKKIISHPQTSFFNPQELLIEETPHPGIYP